MWYHMVEAHDWCVAYCFENTACWAGWCLLHDVWKDTKKFEGLV